MTWLAPSAAPIAPRPTSKARPSLAAVLAGLSPRMTASVETNASGFYVSALDNRGARATARSFGHALPADAPVVRIAPLVTWRSKPGPGLRRELPRACAG